MQPEVRIICRKGEKCLELPLCVNISSRENPSIAATFITMKTMITTVMLLCSVISQSSGLFKCPDDGHWPDPESCASYYHCANGRPYAGTCPAGLLWNGVKSECDFPENVNCDVSIGEAAKFKVRRKV